MNLCGSKIALSIVAVVFVVVVVAWHGVGVAAHKQTAEAARLLHFFVNYTVMRMSSSDKTLVMAILFLMDTICIMNIYRKMLEHLLVSLL